MSEKTLTNKEELFCIEYMVDLNGTKAAIRAGYSEKTARQIASQLLSKLNIQDRIAELKAVRAERTQITADTVLSNLYQMATLDIADILDDDGAIKPISEWTKVWRIAVGGIDVVETKSNEDVLTNVIKKIKGIDKLKAWELIGKHTDVRAFQERMELSGDIGITWNEEKTYEAKPQADDCD